MEPLYCFKVIDEQMNLEKIVITEYHTHTMSQYNPKLIYSWDRPNIVKGGQRGYVIPEDKIDHYANDKVFTFIDDVDRVYGIIYDQVSYDLGIVALRFKNLNRKKKAMLKYQLSHFRHEGVNDENNKEI